MNTLADPAPTVAGLPASSFLTREDRRLGLAQVRKRVAQVSHRSNSAHLGSSLSCIEILDAVLRASGLTVATMAKHDRSRIALSKGHAAMGYYAVFEAAGLIPPHCLENYLANGSSLWGHVTRASEIAAIDVSTGSLGHGLSLIGGFALGYRLRNWAARHYCILSDGECDEGSTWEAALFIGHHRLTKVVAVVDYNKIQSLERVSTVLDLEPFAEKWRSFGWRAEEVDGHDLDALDDVLSSPDADKPLMVIAHTVKGKGIPRIENTIASHYRPAQRGDFADDAVA